MKEFSTSNVNYNIQQPASQADFFDLQEEIFPSISQSEEIPVYTPTRNLKSYSVLPYDGRQIRLGIKDISSNGTYQALEDSVDGYSKVFVNVQPILQNKTTTPSKSTQVISFDSGYQGLENVTINPIPQDYIIPQGSRTATYNANLTYTEDVKSIQTLNVSVNVIPNLQSKTISPSSLSQVIESDYGYQGLSSVTVNAIPDTYVQPSGNKNINITQNGITTQDVFSYSGARIVTAVPASAVDSGTKQTSITTNSTSTIDVIGYANHQIQVNVPNTYAAADQGKVVENGVLIGQTSRNITTNSTVDTTKNNQVVVNVPNTYAASDQGKVVNGGTLVTPGSTTYTANGIYDTTLINSAQINVRGREDLTQPKDVDFIDYDGQLVYSYTANEFLALNQLPANPINQGLIAQGWNWTLADAKEYVAKWGALVIGQNYTTSDGKTRFYISIDSLDAQYRIKQQLCLTKIGDTTPSVNINWGDGEIQTDLSISSSYRSFQHTYTSSGDYIVELEIVEGAVAAGYGWSNTAFWGVYGAGADRRSNRSLKKVEIGNRITQFGNQPFSGNTYLESVSIPTTLGGFFNTNGDSAFESIKMKGIVFPSGFQGRQSAMFANSCNSLRYISLPKSTTLFQIGNCISLRKLTSFSLLDTSNSQSTVGLGYALDLTHLVIPGNYTTMIATVQGSRITKYTIPETVTTVNSEALLYNYYLSELHVLPTNVPAMNNTRALNGLNPSATIYVPYSADHSILQAYKTATNWSSFASYMQEEPQS